jgi:hypothetical protein
VFLSAENYHFPPSKNASCLPSIEGVFSKLENGKFERNMKRIKEKTAKRRHKPAANPKMHRIMFRLSDAERKWFLQLFGKSGKRSYSAFVTDCVLNRPMKIIEINKSAIDFVMLLSNFFTQFRAVKNNFNQVYHALAMNFGEPKTFLR